jgi:hypothetical protein
MDPVTAPGAAVAPSRASLVADLTDTLRELVSPPWADQAAGAAAQTHLDSAWTTIAALDDSTLRSGGPVMEAFRGINLDSIVHGSANGSQAVEEAIDGLANILKVIARG